MSRRTLAHTSCRARQRARRQGQSTRPCTFRHPRPTSTLQSPRSFPCRGRISRRDRCVGLWRRVCRTASRAGGAEPPESRRPCGTTAFPPLARRPTWALAATKGPCPDRRPFVRRRLPLAWPSAVWGAYKPSVFGLRIAADTAGMRRPHARTVLGRTRAVDRCTVDGPRRAASRS